MNKKAILFIVLGFSFLVIAVLLIIKSNNSNDILGRTATVDEMKYYNKLINDNMYQYVGDFEEGAIPESGNTIFSILYSQVDENSVVDDEKKYYLSVDFSNKVYSMSKSKLDEQIKLKYNTTISYNFIETSTTGNILLIDEEFVYYTLPTSKSMYFVQELEDLNNKIKVIIFEFNVTGDNLEYLENCLNNGEIPKNEKSMKKYSMIFVKENGVDKLVGKNTY